MSHQAQIPLPFFDSTQGSLKGRANSSGDRPKPEPADGDRERPSRAGVAKTGAGAEQTRLALPDPSVAIAECDRLLSHGHTFSSPGGHFTYRVIGPCCRLFDREELPWPCCRLQWRSKEPSWRRVGRRFVPDIAAKRSPSYQVEILNPEYPTDPIVLTMYWVKLSSGEQQWWYTKVRAAQSA